MKKDNPDGRKFNLKINDEVLDGFMDKLKAECDRDSECEDMDPKRFIFKGENVTNEDKSLRFLSYQLMKIILLQQMMKMTLSTLS